MNEEPKVYSFSGVALLIGGVQIKGFATGTVITYKRRAKQRASTSGVDGEVVVSTLKDTLADLSFDLMQTSVSNDYLSGMNRLAAAGLPGGSFASFSLRDTNGRSLHEGTCWIEDPPEVGYGDAPGPRKWVLGCTEKNRVDGGNLHGTVAG